VTAEIYLIFGILGGVVGTIALAVWFIGWPKR